MKCESDIDKNQNNALLLLFFAECTLNRKERSVTPDMIYLCHFINCNFISETRWG